MKTGMHKLTSLKNEKKGGGTGQKSHYYLCFPAQDAEGSLGTLEMVKLT